ncbi:hypothetical protein [Spongiivirga citrea]|uniref:DUF1735 domain-containing protein n=1 Tax=Spongiivirga citrea TaxID=1481457 RepID=A0A6M0CQC5_9FLAO|nr:hypothetical protein [Spongiivirga citrea]NER18079.1 hypothetical protein [Spongiivirga citrea]
MRKAIFLLLLSPLLMATQCEDDECIFEETSVDIMTLSPLQETYTKGDTITMTINLPASNNFFGSSRNLFNETADPTALVVLLSDNIFLENSLNFVSGSQGRFSNWFVLPYNSETEAYELEVEVTLNRTGTYSHFNGGDIEIGRSNCPDFSLESKFLNVEDQFIEFTVVE